MGDVDDLIPIIKKPEMGLLDRIGNGRRRLKVGGIAHRGEVG